MKVRILMLSVCLSMLAQGPRTELNDKQKLELLYMMQDSLKADEAAQRSSDAAQALHLKIRNRLLDLKREDNAWGCDINPAMNWDRCTPEQAKKDHDDAAKMAHGPQLNK